MRARLFAGVVLACVVPVSACAGQPPASPPTITSTVTTTVEVPGADPTAWFEAYCGPMGVVETARLAISGQVPQGPAAVKEAAASWASTAAASNRKMADDIEKLGPLGSDVQNPHGRLIKSLRLEANGFEEAAGRVRALAADDKFPERFQQVMASRGGNSDGADVMFKQIVDIPKYAETFRTNKVCTDWQNLAKQPGGK
ncbi:hypothetical protein ACIA8G_36240 [Lentzea sp. NPDC051213]|uniref:hypothetical protein n=1 Tax=Lentzea sp. NPDC051213 TaxID=3364126 RepID=UPI0037981A79